MDKEMKFEVNLSAKDLWQFSMYHANGGMMGIFNLIFTAAAVFLLFVRWAELTDAYRLLLVGCALIFTVLQPALLYNKVRKQAKSPVMQQPMYLTFREDGLKVEQNDQKVDFTWDQMGRMSKKPTLVILYMDRVHAYLLPKSVLGDREEEFYEMVRTHLPKEKRRGI